MRKALLDSFGEIIRMDVVVLGRVSSCDYKLTKAKRQKYIVDFYDSRTAASVVQSLDGYTPDGAAHIEVRFCSADAEPLVRKRNPRSGTQHTAYTLGSAAYQGGIHPRDVERRSSLNGNSSAGWTDSRADTRYSPGTWRSGAWTSQSQSAYPVHGSPYSSRSMARSSSYSGSLHTSTGSSSLYGSGWQEQYPDSLPPQIEAFGRRAQDPDALQSLLNDMDISARVRIGQGLGRPDDPGDRQRIPVQNRIIPERIISGLSACCLCSFADFQASMVVPLSWSKTSRSVAAKPK